MVYAYSENFVLPLSHDEVVHGKGSLVDKMPGDDWQKFANLRLLYGYMFAQPGKKLLFQGGEFAQWREWRHDHSLDWHQRPFPPHAGMERWVSDLNHLYRAEPALHQGDCHAGRVRVDRRVGRGVQRDVLPAPRRRRLVGPGGLQLHPGPANGLPRRRPARRLLARAAELATRRSTGAAGRATRAA